MCLSNPLVDILNPPKEKEGKYGQVLSKAIQVYKKFVILDSCSSFYP
jgi:hypothetical protein